MLNYYRIIELYKVRFIRIVMVRIWLHWFNAKGFPLF